ncbi:MAG: biotin--[acetyl-CoA-carboxylase] ligase [Alphaproteobacteria bacterium]
MAFLHVQQFDAVASTNDEAKRLAAEGAAEGTWVIATEQTGGRGRRGRVWSSPPGNLYSTLILRPPGPVAALTALSFVAAVAVGEAMLTLDSTLPVAYKWPNDVLVGGRKVCGILLESGGTPPWVVIGIGLNIAHHPDDSERPATSLTAAGVTASLSAVRDSLGRALENTYMRWREHGFDPVRQAWLARAIGLGQPITVRLPERELKGVFAALADDGALLLDRDDGQRQRIDAGDVFLPARA